MIRAAAVHDVDALVACGEVMHKESEYSFMPYDKQKVKTVILHHMIEGCVFVADVGGKVVGGLIGGVTDHFFNDDLHGYELAVFILPEHRGGSSALKMMKAFEMWCVDMGAKCIDLGITTGVHEDVTGRFYEKLGYNRSGSLFRKVV
jgi:GNAT superfamily N-acetyltransferase